MSQECCVHGQTELALPIKSYAIMDITQCVPCGGACARAHTHTHKEREREHCMSILLEHSQQYIMDDMFL